jgi:hypothetical protein
MSAVGRVRCQTTTRYRRVPVRRGRRARIRRRLLRAPFARYACRQLCWPETTVTYKELSTAIDGRYHYRQLGDALDILSMDCIDHGEPSLAALVVRADTNVPGDAFLGDAESEQRAYHEHWEARFIE